MGNASLGPDISPLEVLVESIDSNILHLKIGAQGRWEVPKDAIFINTGTGVSQMPWVATAPPCTIVHAYIDDTVC